MVVYFGPEVEKALKNYLEVRKNIIPVEGHEHALFYSTQRKRIGVQAVENLVKKYARQVTTTKKITPHKLRSTLWHRPLPGNRRYLPGSGRFRP